jgi:hypothetical protein
MSCDTEINIIVFRNPYRRLISGFLNKYVEHTKYVEAARKQRADINLAAFDSFVTELSRTGVRYIDKVHFSSQIAKYNRIAFDVISNSEDLEPLRNYINRLFYTDETMPFRVNKYGPKGVHTESLTPEPPSPAEPAWSLDATTLLTLIQSKQTPAYSEFFNQRLKDTTRELYKDDFDFLNSCLERGIINHDVHAQMTSI